MSNLLQNLIPFLVSIRAEKIIGKSIASIESSSYNLATLSKGQRLSAIGKVDTFLAKERERKKTIEDKVKAILFIMTLASFLMINSIKFLTDPNLEISFFSKILISLSLIYFVFSGVASIKALNLKGFHDLYLFSYFTEDSTEIEFKEIPKIDYIGKMYKNVRLNYYNTMIRANYTFSSFVDIRNGFVLLLLFYMSVIWKKEFSFIINIDIYNIIQRICANFA
jgi:hypothetical protein